MSLLRILWGAAEGPGVSVPVPVGGGSVRRGRSVAASGVVAGAIVSVVRGRFAPVSCDSRNLGPSRPETPGERGLPVGTGETRIQPSSRGAGEHPGPLLRAGPSEGSIVARRDHEPLIAATCLARPPPRHPIQRRGQPEPSAPLKNRAVFTRRRVPDLAEQLSGSVRHPRLGIQRTGTRSGTGAQHERLPRTSGTVRDLCGDPPALPRVHVAYGDHMRVGDHRQDVRR